MKKVILNLALSIAPIWAFSQTEGHHLVGERRGIANNHCVDIENNIDTVSRFL